MSNPQEIVKKSPGQAYRDQVEGITKDLLRTMLGDQRVNEAVGRFALAFRAAALSTPSLYEVRPQSLAQALAMCALTGLMPGGPLPDCYLIPRKEKDPATGRWDIPGLQWMVSWRGLQKLVQRTGARIRVVPVWHGEEFRVIEGLRQDLHHVRDVDASYDWEALRAVYVICTHTDGSTSFEVLGKAALEQRRDASDSWKRYKAGTAKDSPWATWPIEMALKTGLRYAISRGIAPIDETGILAYERETADDKPVVIDVPSVSVAQAAPQARQLADRGGLDDLERKLVNEHNQREALVVEAQPAQASPTPAPARTRKPKPEAAPVVDVERDRLVKAMQKVRDVVGAEGSVKARDMASLPRDLPTTSMSVEQLQAFVDALDAVSADTDVQE